MRKQRRPHDVRVNLMSVGLTRNMRRICCSRAGSETVRHGHKRNYVLQLSVNHRKATATVTALLGGKQLLSTATLVDGAISSFRAKELGTLKEPSLGMNCRHRIVHLRPK